MKAKSASEDKKLPALPKPCPSCAFLIPIGCEEMPRVRVRAQGAESTFTSARASWWRSASTAARRSEPTPRSFPYSYEEKQQFYLQLKAYARDKNYAPGWPKANYREKFKEWPAWSWEMLPPADWRGRRGAQLHPFEVHGLGRYAASFLVWIRPDLSKRIVHQHFDLLEQIALRVRSRQRLERDPLSQLRELVAEFA